MKLLDKLTITANKRTLLFLAGSLWTFAGWRLLTLGFEDLFGNARLPFVFLIISSIVFYIFFKFIFSKMVKKHTVRIIKSEEVKKCIFSFFDIKGYIIMIFMISGGITLRNSGIVNPKYLGSFYIGLGLALLIAGILFLLEVIRFNKTRVKYGEN